MPQKTPDENAKLSLDEGAFQRLLSAAFVIQEHNDSLRSQAPDPAEFKASDLSEIAETQNLIRGNRLDLLAAAAVIVDRSQKISHAAAGAIALLSKREISYISSSGTPAPAVGTTLSLDDSLSSECIRTGRIFSLPNLKAVARPQAEFFLSRGMQSFVSIPIRQDQQIAGVMELFFNQPNVVDGTALRTCQLLAGLLTGTVASHQEPPLRAPAPSPSPLPSTPLDQLKPQLDRMLEAEDPDALAGMLNKILQEPAAMPPANSGWSGSSLGPAHERDIHGGTDVPQDTTVVVRCRNCACPLEAEESFCGLCGTARGTVSDPKTHRSTPIATDLALSSTLPSVSTDPARSLEPHADQLNSVSSPSALSEPLTGPSEIPEKSEELPPELQEILSRFPDEPGIVPSPSSSSSSTSASAKIFDSTSLNLTVSTLSDEKDAKPQAAAVRIDPKELKSSQAKPIEAEPTEPEPTETKLTAPKPLNISIAPPAISASQLSPPGVPANPQWKSASETRAWLESVKVPPQRKHWMAEHRANLYLAAAALLLLLVLFGVGTPSDVGAGKSHLGWFDSMLVNLGLAEAPSTPVFLGNPTTKVWVDLHTALYYCPNAELYGKTRGGKFETQRDAQRDQFEPASRHACP